MGAGRAAGGALGALGVAGPPGIPGIRGTLGAGAAGPSAAGGETGAPAPEILGTDGIAGRAPGIDGRLTAAGPTDGGGGGTVVPVLAPVDGGTLGLGLAGMLGVLGIDGRAGAAGGGGPPAPGALIGRPIPTRAAGSVGCVCT